ncbi:hypothetical protein BRADI_4g02520v3 [Brachypodium distachyon]|uniref:Uncharacterized protein n=1 Tax=Brachypodium distachyon TaxID=15368 RepID=A0A2K2CK35_BRADI|nr:hypothetical protein BRADI_4g02520v3 [Brachypodium distachyon]PNT62387.1 hypothetical protein BRADI_4g02520v3 [Brachypodium distachyon]
MNGSGDDDSSSAAADHQHQLKSKEAAGAVHVLREVWEANRKLCTTTDSDDLKRLIHCQGNELQVISLWGGSTSTTPSHAHANGHGGNEAADVGGSAALLVGCSPERVAIMTKAYKDPEICRDFKNRAWVKKLTHPFGPEKFLSDLLIKFRSQHHESDYHNDGQHAHDLLLHHDTSADTLSELMLRLKQHRYLVVIEQQLTSVADWDAIRCLPDAKNGSRVFISTNSLGMALMCTGKPYKVWDLTCFANRRYLCAITREVCGHRIGITGGLIWQLRRRGVISVLYEAGTDQREKFIEEFRAEDKDMMKNLRRLDKSQVLDQVKFEHFYWHDTPLTILTDLAKSFVLSSDPCQKEDLASMRGEDKLDKCRELLAKHKYLVFIENILESPIDWNVIKQYLLGESTLSCTVVITNKQNVATYCVDHNDEHHRALKVKDLIEGDFIELISQLRCPGVISVLYETSTEYEQLMDQLYDRDDILNKLRGLDKSGVLDEVKFERSCWLGQEILADRLARNLIRSSNTKDEQELTSMKGQDIIETCRKLLAEHDHLLFIELESRMDWNSIKQHLLGVSIRGCIVVLTDKQSVAMYCVGNDEQRLLKVKDLMKGSDHSGHGDGGSNKKKEDEYELVGREDDLEFLDSQSKCLDVTSVWGIAGVGKSAIVREYYDKKHRYGMCGWVDVPHPFNPTDLCRQLLLDFYSGDHEAKETAAIGMIEGQDPIQGCCKILRENRCFLVIDGVQSKDVWDLIKATLLSPPILGLTTIVITREESIAKHCTALEEHIWNVKPLQAHVALELFTKQIALNGHSGQLSPQAEEISRLIMSKCGGLPEVIAAIGREWASTRQQQSQDINTLEFINANFMRKLKTISDKDHYIKLKGIFNSMQSIFDACSDELKPCIFYILVFPPDKNIRRRRLLRRWIAEGYSATEEKGEKLFSELMKLNRFFTSSFFCEYIKSQPIENNLVFALEGRCSPSSRLTGRHLTISSCWDGDENVFNSIDFSRLRSLTVFGPWRSFLISDNMKVLRVLDLESTTSDDGSSVRDEDLELIGKLLCRLKFLSLRRCKYITRLPDSLGDMRQLETLDVRHTSVVELPPAVITKLHGLQYIRAGTTQEAAEAAAARTPAAAATPQEEISHSGTSPLVPAARAAVSGVVQGASIFRTARAWKNRACELVEKSSSNSIGSWRLSKEKLDQQSRLRVAKNCGGVEVFPAAARGVGNLTDLHTLGVVNVAGGGKGGLLFLKELKKLTQLRKLGLSGINRNNWDWNSLCNAVSGHLRHLESLSLQLMLLKEDGNNFEFARFDDITDPPKTLKRLKVLYGRGGHADADAGAWIRPSWTKKLPNLKKLSHGNLGLTVSSQEDIDMLSGMLFEMQVSLNRLRVKLIEEQELKFAQLEVEALMIDCSTTTTTLLKSKVTFQDSGYSLEEVHVKVLNIHCCSSCGLSCLQISGLKIIEDLKEVLVTGSCGDDLKQDLLKQLQDIPEKPVTLKVNGSTVLQ